MSNNIWNFIENRISNGCSISLVVMVDAEGNGPNRPGAKLAVSDDGQRCGTVGGGASEFSLVQTATDMLSDADNRLPEIIAMAHENSDNPDASGMICSGTQIFAVVCLTPDNLAEIQEIIAAEADNRSGTIRITPDGFCFKNDIITVMRFQQNGSWLYEEPLGGGITVTLIGGGHVSLALTPILKKLGMRVRVLDNRKNLSTMEHNTEADEKLVISYNDIPEYVQTGSNSYVCIMTFGHKNDKDVLCKIAALPLGYLGMMGSDPKIAQIMQQLKKQGISTEALDAVHAPIGIPIGSNTPEEIAISIAAQIIAVRNMPQNS
jgi:xanthine dehydrogenase accessory factor